MPHAFLASAGPGRPMPDALVSNNITTRNFVLSSLPQDEAAALAPHLSFVEMPHAEVIFEPDDRIEHIIDRGNEPRGCLEGFLKFRQIG